MIPKLTPDEKIIGLNRVVGDFWSWAYSDILSNRNRSVFAEFLVGALLGVIDKPRIEWDAFDFIYQDKKIEVKSSAYIQSWKQDGLSKITFDIAKKKPWNSETNTLGNEAIRSADCYVFCLYPETDSNKINVLDALAWQFFVISAERIYLELGNQKSVGLKRIQAMCKPVGYEKLKDSVDFVLGLGSN
jgi:hypothetical protein